jgi:hypothetical protein
MCNRPRRFVLLVSLAATIALTVVLSSRGQAQTPSTDALTGMTLDPLGALFRGATLSLVNRDTDDTESTDSDEAGRFGFLLLKPGTYRLCAGAPQNGQKSARYSDAHPGRPFLLWSSGALSWW